MIILAKTYEETSYFTYKVHPVNGFIEVYINSTFNVNIDLINKDINIKRARQLLSSMSSGTLTITNKEDRFKTIIRIPIAPKECRHYILVDTVIHIHFIKKYLDKKGVSPLIIKSIKEIEDDDSIILYAEPNNEILVANIDNININKLYLLINDESEEVELVEGKTSYLNKNKISDDKYLEYTIEVLLK